jgi:4-hydroxy-tetrahydrodipicolinate synthase
MSFPARLKRGPAKRVHGLFPALLTPFDNRGRVDREALASLVRFQMAHKVDGIYPCGSTGLGPLLDVEERKVVAESVVAEAGKELPVVVQVGCADTGSTVELARHAEKVGAYAVASLTPYYYKPGDTAITKHFETVAKSVSIPLLAYNIPQFTGNNLQPKAIASLARQGTIAGVKDSSRDVIQLLDLLNLVPENFVVMNGTEEYALFAMMMGGDGVVSGAANAYPEVFHTLVTAHDSGNLAAAASAQKRILAFREAVKDAPIPSYYEILKARGLDCGGPRAPFLPLTRDDRAQLLARMDALGVPTSPKE